MDESLVDPEVQQLYRGKVPPFVSPPIAMSVLPL
jgi:hypothetical protein